jgi:hypothetical protein
MQVINLGIEEAVAIGWVLNLGENKDYILQKFCSKIARISGCILFLAAIRAYFPQNFYKI